MKFLLSLLVLISTNVFALDWSELAEGSTYTLTQDLSLTQLERSKSMLEIPKGETFSLGAIHVLPINVFMFELFYNNCPGGDMRTDMEIIPVQETNPVVEMGVLLERGCVLQVLIEAKDYYKKSMFN